MDNVLLEELGMDFKDLIDYKNGNKICSNMTNIKKWMIYDSHKKDADVVLKRKENSEVLSCLKWDTKHIDLMFPIRYIIRFLPHKPGDKEDKNTISDIIDFDEIEKILKDDEIIFDEWKKSFECELDKFCRNVHTIGNYMPCPDKDYNKIKGGIGQWHYNDRIDLLFRDIQCRECENGKGDKIISKAQSKKWEKWFKDNKNELMIEEILDDNMLDRLGKLKVIKQKHFTKESLKELPDFLCTVNKLIENRSKRILSKVEQEV